jgi:adenosylcobinamide-GDP ribazoletransferase
VREALAFLTPLGGARTPTPRALPWFTVVGAAVGAGVGGAWWAGTRIWTPLVGAALAIVVDLALTGMLHVDGLADSADGLLPHLPRERRLDVMARPDIGAFGVAAIGGALVLELAVLASMRPDVVLVVALWSVTRGQAALALASMRYARPGGLAEAFRGRPAPAVAMLLVALAVLAVRAPAAALVSVLAAAGVLALAHRRIGGFTGDVLGAAIVVAQVLALLAAAA